MGGLSDSGHISVGARRKKGHQSGILVNREISTTHYLDILKI
jgi:hypothetical protein